MWKEWVMATCLSAILFLSESRYFLWVTLFDFESRYLFLSHVICFWDTLFVSESRYWFLSHVICFWVMFFLFLSYVVCFWVTLLLCESCYLFLSHVICFWATLFVSESRYLFLSHVICFWVTLFVTLAVLFVSESCHFLCYKAVTAPVTVQHLNPPILFVSHRKPIDSVASLPHCGSFCKLSLVIFRILLDRHHKTHKL
jgi:hypothetical protein